MGGVNLVMNFRVEFTLLKNDYLTKEMILDKPIIINENPVGYIDEVIETDMDFHCKGLVWDRFINIEFFQQNNELSSVIIG